MLLRSEKVSVWNNLIKVITSMPIPSELFCTLDFIQCISYYYVLFSLPHICQHIFCLKIEKILIISHFITSKYPFLPPPLFNTSWAQERGWEWEWKEMFLERKRKNFLYIHRWKNKDWRVWSNQDKEVLRGESDKYGWKENEMLRRERW